MSTVQRKIQPVPFRTCEATTVTPKELYFSLDRSVLRYLCRKIPSQKISVYSLRSSQEKHEKEIHRNCNCHESHMFKYRLVQLISSTLCHKDMPYRDKVYQQFVTDQSEIKVIVLLFYQVTKLKLFLFRAPSTF